MMNNFRNGGEHEELLEKNKMVVIQGMMNLSQAFVECVKLAASSPSATASTSRPT